MFQYGRQDFGYHYVILQICFVTGRKEFVDKDKKANKLTIKYKDY